MSITLTNLITQSRYRADAENTQHCTDLEITDYLNSEIAELHDLLTAEYDTDYNLSSADTTTTTATSYSLPTDFYKLKGVDYGTSGSQLYTLVPFNFNERNVATNINYYYFNNTVNLRYRLQGSNIILTPAPESGKLLRIWYTPVATKLVNGSDVLNDLNQYYEYVVTGAAIRILLKEESDVSVLMAMKADLRKRIVDMAANRDAGNPSRITDVTAGTF